jgi:hypothetical protein
VAPEQGQHPPVLAEQRAGESSSRAPTASRLLGKSIVPLVAHLLVFVAVLAAVWLPELTHWHVSPTPTSGPAIAQARSQPDNATLREIGSLQLRGVPVPPDQTLARADEVARGTLNLPGFPPAPVKLPFAATDLERGPPTWQLMVASLAGADLLLDGYLASGRQEWLDLAETTIVAFARHESQRWLDQGLMWNDHAISARVPVLAKFWSIHRGKQDPSTTTTQAVLGLISRSAMLLMKDDAYAWRTSHGILANLALLQIAAAFPYLPEAESARRVAVSRLAEHIKYWINQEGVTLLHSAGYHSGSLYHLSMALRLMTLNGLAIPADWWMRFDRAVDHEAMLRRPDGTLPLIGDTANLTGALLPLVTARGLADEAAPLRPLNPTTVNDASALLPGAGYAIWRDVPAGSDAQVGGQTVMTWSYYPGLGHKLADELSVVLWARGQTWITNTGYWPYGAWGRNEAESWTASNAPHLVGESKSTQRGSTALFTGEQQDTRFIDVERRGPDGYLVRRQLLRVAPADAWLVLDHGTDDRSRDAMAAWTFAADVSFRTLIQGQHYVAASDQRRGAISVSFASSNQSKARLHKGSRSPFLGWVVVEREPQPAPSVTLARQAHLGWSLAAFSWAPDPGAAGGFTAVAMQQWQDAEHWTALLPSTQGEITVERRGALLRLGGAITKSINLTPVAGGIAARADALAAYDKAANGFHRFPELIAYRTRVTKWLAALFACQLSILTILRWRAPRASTRLDIAIWTSWLAGGTWLHQFYLV